MPFTLPLQVWKALNYLTSFCMMLSAPVSSKYEVLLVSAIKLNMLKRNRIGIVSGTWIGNVVKGDNTFSSIAN